jgi:hypothetical protein
MELEVQSAAGAAAQKTAPIAPPAQDGKESEESERVNLSLADVRALVEEATRPLHAEMRRIREGKPGRQEAPAERTLTMRVQEIEAREQRLAERSKLEAIKEQALEAGVPADRLAVFVNHVLAEKGKSIVGTPDGGVAWVDLDPDNPKPLGEMINGMLRGPAGDMFRAPSRAPVGRGLRPSSRPASTNAGRNYGEIPKEERLKMTLAERAEIAAQSIEQG